MQLGQRSMAVLPMTETRGIPKPESLEAKFKLLALLPFDRRAKRKHSLVFGFILDWYHSKYGDALASVRHVASTIKERDPAGVGLYAGDVHSVLSDLVAWGYLERQKGTGRRASRYMPVWSKLRSVHKTPNTTEDEISVRENANTCVRENANTTGDSVREIPNEDPSTRTRSQDQGTGVNGQVDCAAPTAPPAPPAVAADAAVTAQGGFEELYAAYGVRKNKADARRAYEKLAPDAELHGRMVVAAHVWRDAAGDVVVRMHLARWIREERYDEDPKGERKPPAPSKPKPDFTIYSNRPATGTITRAAISTSDDNGATLLEVWFTTKDGETVDHIIVTESPDAGEQEIGQAELNKLLHAVDLDDIASAEELVGRPVDLMLTHRGHFVSVSRPFVPAPSVPQGVPKFADVVARTPLGGWASMIGTAYDDEDMAA